MPTVLREGSWYVLVHVDDHPPPHVHVRRPGAEAKVNLSPVTLTRARGFSVHEALDAVRLVERNRERLLLAWRRIHG